MKLDCDCDYARQMKAEVERLRAENKDLNWQLTQGHRFCPDHETESAYRAAVAEVRKRADDMIQTAWIDGDASDHPAHGIIDVLDKLPKDAP